MANEIASFYATIGADVKDFKQGLTDVKNDMGGMEKSSAALGNAFKLAFAVGVTAVVGFGAVIGKSIGAAADMEQGVADIGAMMNLTAADTQQLGDYILDLGLDPNLKVSATEASAAIMSLGTAGLSASQIMDGAAKSTVLLANATGLSGESGLASAASIATDVMAQFNVKASDMDAAVSAIAGTTVASKFTIDDYRLAIAQAGGVAGSVGLGFDDFNAIIAATSSSFASGSDAGTSLKTMIQRLVPSTNDAKDAMDQLGLRTADGSSKFFDAAGNMKSAEEIAGLLHTAFSGLSDAQSIEAATTIFGTDAMRTALALANGGVPIIEKMKAQIGDVSAEELATKRMDTFKGAMEIAQGVIETLSISIGQAFLPVLRPLVELFTTLAQTYGPVVIDFFKQVATTVAGWIKPFTEAMTSTEGVQSNLKKIWDNVVGVMGVISAALKPIGDVIDKFFDWQDVLGAVGVLLAGPVLAAIWGIVTALAPVIATLAAVTAAVAAFRWAWQNDLGGVRTYVENTLKEISDWFFTESGIWKGTWEATGAYIAERVEYFFKYKIYNLTVGTWSTIREDLKLTWGILKNRAEEWVRDQVAKVLFLKNEVEGYLTNMKDRILTLWHEWIDPTKKEITDWYGITSGKIEQFVGNVRNAMTDVKDWIIEKWQGVLDWYTEHIQPMVDRGKELIQGFWDGIKFQWNRFTGWAQTTFQGWIDWFDRLFDFGSPSKVMEQRGEWTVEGFAKGISNSAGLVQDAMSSAFGDSTMLENAIGQREAKDIFEKISKQASDAFGAFQQGNVATGNPAYDIANMVMKDARLGSGVGIAALKHDIDALVQMLGETGAGYIYGANAKKELGGTSDYLGALMGSITAGQGPPPGAGGGSPLGADTLASGTVLEVLKAILAALVRSGQVDERGFEKMNEMLTRIADPRYGILVSNTAALAR